MKSSALLLTSLLLLCPFIAEAKLWNITCPSHCTCTIYHSLRTLNCSSSGLTTIPHAIPEGTEALILSNNNIKSIEKELPQLPSLRVLDLSNNKISTFGVSKPIFQNLTALQILNLSNNKLQSLLHGSFSGLRSLDKLILSHNQISFIEGHAFGGLNQLDYLSLYNNKLPGVHADWFESLTHLTELILANNQIVELKDGNFNKLYNLKKLSLTGNRLTVMKTEHIKDIENLQTLVLDGNKFTEVPKDVLLALKKLRTFSFDSNPVKSIKTGSFSGLKNLKILNLNTMPELLFVDEGAFTDLPELGILQMHDNEKLIYLDGNAFKKCPDMKYLYIHNNKLIALPEQVIKSLPTLQEVTVYHNPVHCDCNIHWMRKYLENQKTHLEVKSTTMKSAIMENETITVASNNTSEVNGTSNEGNVTTPKATTTTTTVTTTTTIPITTTNVPQINFKDAGKIVCDMPTKFNSEVLFNIDLADIPQTCAPTVLPFFSTNSKHHLKIGDDLKLDCRALGVPKPSIYFCLPNGKMVNKTSADGRVLFQKSGTLKITHITAEDNGTVMCIASNNKSQSDTSTAMLHVRKKNVNIVTVGITDNMVTVSLNGSDVDVTSHNYHIRYKIQGTGDSYKIIHIPSNGTQLYSIPGLEAETMYEFCIAVEHNDYVTNLDCANISTDKPVIIVHEYPPDISGHIALTIVFVCISILTVFVLIFVMFLKRRCRRQSYKEPPGVTYRVGNISNINLETLYSPPSTPIHSAKTSLVKHAYGPAYA